jgi:hypothetical protein
VTQSNSGQRKMMRRMSPGGGQPFHDAPLPSDGKTPQSSLSAKLTRRAAKKQIKTRENRASRREEL